MIEDSSKRIVTPIEGVRLLCPTDGERNRFPGIVSVRSLPYLKGGAEDFSRISNQRGKEHIMKGAIYHGEYDITIEELDYPECGPKDVILQVKRAGICGSDLSAWRSTEGGNMAGIYEDFQMGHEMVGLIHEVGSDVTDIQVGDRVWVNPTRCKREGKIYCDVAGAFSEYVGVEDAAWGWNLHRLPDDVSWDEGVIIEPFAVGTHGKNRVCTKPDENVVIFGAGTIGLSALCAAVAQGNKNVVVSDVRDDRLEIVNKLGGVGFNSATDSLFKFLKSHFGEVENPYGFGTVPNVDVFIDAAGAPPILETFAQCAKWQSRLSVLAVYKKNIPLDLSVLVGKQTEIYGACMYTDTDIAEVFDNITNHRTGIPSIVTHRFKHEDIVEAFKTADDIDTGAIKVIIDYDL